MAFSTTHTTTHPIDLLATAEMAKVPHSIITEQMVSESLPAYNKFAHKGDNGHGLLIAGAHGMMGAAVLAATAALHSGIGLLTCHVPAVCCDIMQIATPEAIIDVDALGDIFSNVEKVGIYDAIAVGPGLGKAEKSAEGLCRLLSSWRGLTILDADALNILSEHREMLKLLHPNCILTPHPKEFARLIAGHTHLPTYDSEISPAKSAERLDKLINFAVFYRSYVILKGAHTAVVSPEGSCYFNTTGNPGMAKGGMGDVLTGTLLALAANGMHPLDVALSGVYAHGLAGDIVADEIGERGMCAGDVARGMSKAWKHIA
ncbi:hypothetical protein FACS1894199_05840 [Bacteroidia bacterium]|nr:hypothetical protein FACS1894199_05840 [Bacteroidia bacterium]